MIKAHLRALVFINPRFLVAFCLAFILMLAAVISVLLATVSIDPPLARNAFVWRSIRSALALHLAVLGAEYSLFMLAIMIVLPANDCSSFPTRFLQL
jgi:hypothetical protein